MGYVIDYELLISLLQDVCIPDLIKLLDILGDNGVSLTFNICFPLYDILSEFET